MSSAGIPFATFYREFVRNLNRFNIALAGENTVKISKYLGALTGLRIFVAEGAGFGHQASTVTILQRVIALGYGGTIEVVYEQAAEANLKVLLPGFTGGDMQGMPYRGAVLNFTAVDVKELPHFSPQPLGITGGMDQGALEQPASQLNVKVFIELQPVGWEGKSSKERESALNRIWFEDSGQPIVLRKVNELGGPYFDNLAFNIPDPALSARDWVSILNATPEEKRNNLERAQDLIDFLDEKPALANFLPAYGLLLPPYARQPVTLNLYWFVLTLLAALVKLQENATIPVVLSILGTDQRNFWPTLQTILNKHADEDLDDYLEETLGATAKYRAYYIGLIKKIALNLPLFSFTGTPEELRAVLRNLNRNQILLVGLDPVPPPVFNLLFSKATLPYVFEGQATANLALNLGKPFLKMANLTHAGQLSEILYQLPMMDPVQDDVFKTVQNVLITLQGLCDPNVDENVQLVYALLQRALANSSSDPFSQYFAALRLFYQSNRFDKLVLALAYLLSLQKKTTLQLMAVRLAAPADQQTPLQQLNDALNANLSSGTLNLYPGAISGTDPIPATLAALSAGAGVSITGATIDFPSPYTTITVNGQTSAFAGVSLNATIVFTLAEDQQTLVVALTLAGDTLTFSGAPWFSIANPQVTANISNAGIRNFGSISGTVIIGSTKLGITANLPTSTTVQVGVDLSQNPPSLEGLFQFIGGFSLTNSLPQPLNALTGLSLQNVGFDYDSQQQKLQGFNVELQTKPQWKPLGASSQLSLDTIDFTFLVSDPTGARTLSWTAVSQFSLGPGTINVGLSYPNFTITGLLAEDSKPIPIGNLVSYFLGSNYTVPISGNLTSFNLLITPGTPTVYSVGVNVTGNWPVPSASLTVFSVEQLGFQIDGQGSSVTGSISGAIQMFPKEPDITFGLTITAAYGGADAGWTISGKQNDQPIKVSRILKTYLGSKWFTEKLPDFDVTGLDVEIHTGSKAPGPYFTFSATVKKFAVQPFGQDFTVAATASFGKSMSSSQPDGDGPPKLPFAKVGADVTWNGIALHIMFDYAPNVQKYAITWHGITAELRQETVGGSEHWVCTLSFNSSVTLGSMVEDFVSWATGYKYGLASPWNLLNEISLNGLQLGYDFTAGTVDFTFKIGPIELGFATITNIGLTYNAKASGDTPKVEIALEGSFPWNQGSTDKLSWDATDPSSTKAPPGNGNEYLDLRLLALGQHVTVPGIDQADTVEKAITALAKMPDPSGDILPPVTYAPGSSWLVGMDFGLLKLSKDDPASKNASYSFSLQVVFNDPNLYGLRLQLEGEPAKILGGLQFEVLYRRISDTLGVYQAEITLPTAIRTIQTGIYTIQLPTFDISVYTNGDFQADFGFPWNDDFSRSFMVQAIIPPGIPLLGAGGFYFGKLSSATTNAVPAVLNGTFNPVIVFGFGAEAGFGKSVTIGPLSASFSLVVLGIIEGVLGRWNPFLPDQQGATSTSQLDGTYYYSITGIFGIAGTLNGSVDFAIIKASVNIAIVVTASISFIAYEPIVLSVAASVDATASLEINLGFFSITFYFHFSVSVRETFQIGTAGNPPWQLADAQPSGRLTAPLALRLSSMRVQAMEAVETVPVWTNLEAPSTPLPLKGYLTFALTAAGDAAQSLAQQVTCYVALLAVDGPPPVTAGNPFAKAGDAAQDSSFEALAKLVARWAIAAFQAAPMSSQAVDALVINDDALRAIAKYLSDYKQNPDPMPMTAIEQMLEQQVEMTLWGPGDIGPNTPNIPTVFFPVPLDLSLSVPAYGSQPAYGYTFAGYNTLSSTGVSELRTYFDQLAVQISSEQQALKARLAATNATTSVASFVFGDYFLLLARQMMKALRDGLRDYKYVLPAGQTPQNVVDWVNKTGEIPADELFTVSDLFIANANATLSNSKSIAIMSGAATATVQPGQTFDSIAGAKRYGRAFTAAQLAQQNLANARLLQPDVLITFNGASTKVNSGDTLTTVAARLNNADPNALASDPALLGQSPLLLAYAQITLPEFFYTTGTAGGTDTLASVAAMNGITVAQLGLATANAGIANLFAQTGTPTFLDLPHLPQMPVGVLLQEIQITGGLQHLSGMISRFHLHGLRLPTDQITPNTLGMWVSQGSGGRLSLPPFAGLYALTGQQFEIPVIGSNPFAFSISDTGGPSWLTFKNGTKTITTSIAQADSTNTAITVLRSYITSTSLTTNLTEIGAQSMVRRSPATYSFGSYVAWIAPALPTLPYGTAPAGATPRIWAFPTALSAILDHAAHVVNPTFVPMTQTYDQATGQTVSAPIVNYGWASKLAFTIKRVPAVAGSPASITTYQIVGTRAADIVLLENIVAQFADDSSIEGMWLAYAPDPALGTSGLETGSATAAFGIGQANLSTVTHPSSSNLLVREAVVTGGPAALNGNAVFLRLLWEASITAQGGFYLYYDDNGAGLPGSIFDRNGQAEVTIIVVYGADKQNQVYDCMNALVINDPINPKQSAVVAQASPIPASANLQPQQTLEEFAASIYADIADLAHDNAGKKMTDKAQVVVNGGTYMVSPLGSAPGGQLAAIAAYFGISNPQTIIAANPRIPSADWNNGLQACTPIRLPSLTVTVGTSPGGTTLGSIADYYGADVVGLAVDNQTVPGLFTASLRVAGGPVTSASRLSPGNQMLVVQRPVPDEVPSDPTKPGYAQDLMLNQFSLLGYQISGNQDFNTSHLGVPVGPSGGGGTGVGKLRVPLKLAAGQNWTYTVVLSYGAVLAGTVTGNPYQGVGRLLQVDLAWLDIFGNTIISDLSSPQVGGSGTLNRLPLLLGYTDALIGLSRWPSVNATWQVNGQSSAPQLSLTFSFQTGRYQDKDGVKNATADGKIYAQLAAQLDDPNGIAFSVESSLTEAPFPITGASLTALRAWISAIQTYLAAVSGGTPQPAPAPLLFSFPLTGLTTAQVFKLTCSFVMTRPGGIVEGEFAAVPGIASSSALLSAAGAATGAGLASFAQDFQNALTQKNSMLTVMAGPDRFQSGGVSSSTLWVLLTGLAAGQPVSYAISDESAPLIFAPAPISTSLISRANVPIFAYEKGKPINFKVPSYRRDFANVDMDQWVQQIFAAVDTLLSPQFIAPLVILDCKLGTATLAMLQGHKAQLANMYASQMAAVFDDQKGASNATVQEIFGEDLLEQLGNAYRTQAALQFSANVTATIAEQPAPAAPPNLYGPIVQTGSSVSPGIAFTSTKLPLATATTPLAFLVATPGQIGGDTSASYVAVDLNYTPTHIEHQIGNVPGITGYLASSWLQFVLPPPAPGENGSMAAALGSFDIPLVLRAYPATPAMVGQTWSQTNKNANDISEVTQWTYAFTYSLPMHYPQDTVYVSVLFNVKQDQLLAAANLADTFPWLAEFVTVYPSVETDLLGALATITAQTTDPTVLANSLAAINALNAMLGKIDGLDSQGVRDQSSELPSFVVHRAPQSRLSSTADCWAFTLQESPATINQQQNVLLMTVTVTSGNVPQVQVAEYTAVPYTGNALPPNTYQYYYVDGKQQPLDFGKAQSIAERQIVFPGLQILDLQDALATAHVTRNEHLVDSGRKTNDRFVYRTPDASFTDACMPSIGTAQTIDVAMIGSSNNQPVTRSLSAHLTALFQALSGDASASTLIVQVVVTYQYAVNPLVPALAVTLPVLMQPPLPVSLSGPPPVGGVTQERMIADLTSAITGWFANNQPSLANGTIQLSVMIMSSLTAQPVPLLNLTSLELQVQYVQPALAGTPRALAQRGQT